MKINYIKAAAAIGILVAGGIIYVYNAVTNPVLIPDTSNSTRTFWLVINTAGCCTAIALTYFSGFYTRGSFEDNTAQEQEEEGNNKGSRRTVRE